MNRDYINTSSLLMPGKRKNVFIVFEGVMTDAEVTINGRRPDLFTRAGSVKKSIFF